MNHPVIGEWKMLTCRYTHFEGQWVDEAVYASSSIYTAQGRVTVFMRTSELAFGYTGRYEYQDGRVTTHFEGSTEAHLEGTTWTRDFMFEGPDRFRVVTVDPATGQKVETIWERCRT